MDNGSIDYNPEFCGSSNETSDSLGLVMPSKSVRVLVVDDEPAIRRLLRTILSTQDYEVIEEGDGNGALECALGAETPDVMLLDLGLPDMEGLQIIRDIRSSGSVLPIVVLSNRSDEGAKVAALDLGATDYVTKPFGARELLARIRAALRHRLQMEGERPIFRAGDLTVDHVRRIVSMRAQEIKLSPKEYALLSLLVMNAGKVLTHKCILDELWGGEQDVQYIRIYVRSLRQKLGELPGEPSYIRTEQGVGYRFIDPADAALLT
jgi:two-component system, OmpR family, KDP operon response regulator KdpE